MRVIWFGRASPSRYIDDCYWQTARLGSWVGGVQAVARIPLRSPSVNQSFFAAEKWSSPLNSGPTSVFQIAFCSEVKSPIRCVLLVS